MHSVIMRAAHHSLQQQAIPRKSLHTDLSKHFLSQSTSQIFKECYLPVADHM